MSSRPGRAASHGPGNAARQGTTDATRTPVFAYLKVYGLNQYARAFAAAGLSELDAIGKLSETEALDFLEQLRIYPGHKLRLLRAVESLRHAAMGADRREDDVALRRLCSQKEELSREKAEAESENRRCQEENRRLLELVREQGAQLQKERDRVMELEDLVRTQTEQVHFLVSQLHAMAEAGGPQRVNELFESYRQFGGDEWQGAERIDLEEPVQQSHSMPQTRPRSYSDSDSLTRAPHAGYHDSPMPFYFERATPQSKLAKSMDLPAGQGAQGVDNLIKCLATALQNKIILSVGKPRPHNASAEGLAACSIFVEPVYRDMLERQARHEVSEGPSDIGTPLSSACSPLLSRASVSDQESTQKPAHPLNAIAVRRIPNKWDIYDFLEAVIRSLEVHPEVSVVTLVYVDRFCEMSGVAFTPDNWQRLTITAMMLASKVWYDESYENLDFAEKFDLYTLNEINTFERIFLKSVSYDMSVKAVQYAQTYFFLRTLGAKDSGEFTLPPLDDVSASRLQERCMAKQVEFKKRYLGDNDFSVTTAF
ncbi:unnamed protein product [Effrenium voratum]|nr:unnamed protein product [Effrenium voratum]